MIQLQFDVNMTRTSRPSEMCKKICKSQVVELHMHVSFLSRNCICVSFWSRNYICVSVIVITDGNDCFQFSGAQFASKPNPEGICPNSCLELKRLLS